MKRYDKILGCLVGAAAGDAMGAPTELRSRSQIKEYFNGGVRDFLPVPDDTIGIGNLPGQITDDFSLAMITVQTILANGGRIDEAVAKEALITWSEHPVWFDRFVGPTTSGAIARMKSGAAAGPGSRLVNNNSTSSDGAAMKIAPAALLSGGDIDKAIDDAITICAPTHPNNIALSGAGAVAAATAAALMEEADLFSVVQAGLYGARKAETLGRAYHENAGANVEKRIRLAVSIGMTAESLEEATVQIGDVIGSGLAANEAVPAAFGLMVAARGNARDAILAAANIGYDTDTVATMCGGMLGALYGMRDMPDHWLPFINRQNGIDLEDLATQIDTYLTGAEEH